MKGKAVTVAIYRSLSDEAAKAAQRDTRDDAKEMMRLIESRISAVASVILPTGFIAASFRAVITGLMLVVRPKYAFKSFSAIEDCIEWIVEHAPDHGGPDAKRYFETVVAQQIARQDALRAQRKLHASAR